jgi:hypothetical protein
MTDLRLEMGQDLTGIAEMFVKLRSEAVNRAGDPDIPGGAAMVLLGPGADIEAWGYVQLSAIFGRLNLGIRGTTKHEQTIELDAIAVEDVEPPLSFLASWADIVRDARGQQPSTRRARISDEIAYLRSAMDWMLSSNEYGEPWFIQVEDFAAGLHNVRTALENVLHDGERSERIRAKCNRCSERPRLTRVYGFAKDGSEDGYRCHECGADGGTDWVARCWHKMIAEKGDAPEWVTVKVASAATGRPAKTIRRWTEVRADGTAKVESRYRGDDPRLLEVRWADVRAAHDTSERRPWQQVA